MTLSIQFGRWYINLDDYATGWKVLQAEPREID
jgi:hypothetical protein